MNAVNLMLWLLFECYIAIVCRYWDQEVQWAAKDLRTPRLTRVLIACYWRSYSVIGIFTLIEVPQTLSAGIYLQYSLSNLPMNV